MALFKENECVYGTSVGMELLNGSGLMKPGGYQSLVMEIAERHLRQFGIGVDDLLRDGMAWVLVSSSVEIIEPIRREMSVKARTWHSEQDRFTFRRELCFTDEDDRPLFNAATFSVLMDVRERKILRPDKTALSIGDAHSEFLLEASPKLRFRDEMLPCDRRKVYPSCIDRLGHTNNCRYSEFAYDALTEEEIGNLAQMRRMDVFFKSELTPGEYFIVRRSTVSSVHGELIIDGIHESTGKQSFICRMVFQ